MTRRDFSQTALLPFLIAAAALGDTKDPWSRQEIIEADDFAREISSRPAALPRILYVGFPILYKGAHIKGAVLAGPCSKPEGLAELRRVAAALPRDTETVIYCGCCPIDRCPNIRPAYSALHAMEFRKLKVLYLPVNLHTDWTVKGYPVDKSL